MLAEHEKPIAKYNNIELYKKQLVIDGTPIKITRMEESFLEYAMNNPGETLSRTDILKNTWKGTIVRERSIDALVCKLREKLPKNHQDLIKSSHTNVHHGYVLGKDKNEGYTMIEQKIIYILKTNPDIIVSYSDILKLTHQADDWYNMLSLRVILYKLRKKLKEDTKDTIITKKNIGLQWNTKKRKKHR